MIDLDFAPETLPVPTSRAAINRFTTWLSGYLERPIHLPASYVELALAARGGVPGKACFSLPSGVRRVCRFFNFLTEEDLGDLPRIPSWRTTCGRSASPDVRLDYRVWRYFDEEPWAGLVADLDGDVLPIACLDTAGHDARDMAEYDLLGLDLAEDEPPVVLYAYHAARLGPVAPSFDAFLARLGPCPGPRAEPDQY